MSDKKKNTTERIERAQLRWGNTGASEYDVRVIDDGERETIHILPMPIRYGRQLGTKKDKRGQEETEVKDDERPKKSN